MEHRRAGAGGEDRRADGRAQYNGQMAPANYIGSQVKLIMYLIKTHQCPEAAQQIYPS